MENGLINERSRRKNDINGNKSDPVVKPFKLEPFLLSHPPEK
jgi:hypothetical protein